MRRTLSIITLAASLIAVSCDNSEQFTSVPQVNLSQNCYEIPAEGGSFTFEYQSNIELAFEQRLWATDDYLTMEREGDGFGCTVSSNPGHDRDIHCFITAKNNKAYDSYGYVVEPLYIRQQGTGGRQYATRAMLEDWIARCNDPKEANRLFNYGDFGRENQFYIHGKVTSVSGIKDPDIETGVARDIVAATDSPVKAVDIVIDVEGREFVLQAVDFVRDGSLAAMAGLSGQEVDACIYSQTHLKYLGGNKFGGFYPWDIR